MNWQNGKNLNKNESFPLKEDSPKLTRLNPLPFLWNSMIFQIVFCMQSVCCGFVFKWSFFLHPFPMLTIEMTCVTCHFHVFVVIVIYFFICLKKPHGCICGANVLSICFLPDKLLKMLSTFLLKLKNYMFKIKLP